MSATGKLNILVDNAHVGGALYCGLHGLAWALVHFNVAWAEPIHENYQFVGVGCFLWQALFTGVLFVLLNVGKKESSSLLCLTLALIFLPSPIFAILWRRGREMHAAPLPIFVFLTVVLPFTTRRPFTEVTKYVLLATTGTIAFVVPAICAILGPETTSQPMNDLKDDVFGGVLYITGVCIPFVITVVQFLSASKTQHYGTIEPVEQLVNVPV